MAGAAVTQVRKPYTVCGIPGRVIEVIFDFLADAADGTFLATGNAILDPEVSIPKCYPLTGYRLDSVLTNPGTTAPTDNYDLQAIDEDGVDVLGGLLMNRDTSVSERVAMQSIGEPKIFNSWTVTLTNNSVNAASVRVKFRFLAPGY